MKRPCSCTSARTTPSSARSCVSSSQRTARKRQVNESLRRSPRQREGRKEHDPLLSPRSTTMMQRNPRLAMLAMLALGGALGWLAASGRLDALLRANTKSHDAVAARESPTAPQSATPCCDAGADRNTQLIRANVPGTLAGAA